MKGVLDYNVDLDEQFGYLNSEKNLMTTDRGDKPIIIPRRHESPKEKIIINNIGAITNINKHVVVNIDSVNIENIHSESPIKNLKNSKTVIPRKSTFSPFKKSRTLKSSLMLGEELKRKKVDCQYCCKKCWKDLSKFTMKVVKSIYWSIFSSIIAFTLLILSDITYLTMSKDYDYIIEYIFLFGFCFLSLEILLTFIFMELYRFSFFFFIDCFAVFCLLPIIQDFNDPIFNPEGYDYIIFKTGDS